MTGGFLIIVKILVILKTSIIRIQAIRNKIIKEHECKPFEGVRQIQIYFRIVPDVNRNRIINHYPVRSKGIRSPGPEIKAPPAQINTGLNSRRISVVEPSPNKTAHDIRPEI